MASYHLQIFLAGIPNERCFDAVLDFLTDNEAEHRLCQEWDTYGSSRKMATLNKIFPSGDMYQFFQIGPFDS